MRRGWKGIMKSSENNNSTTSENYVELSQIVVNRAARTGGTFLHSSRTRHSSVRKVEVRNI
ncbi:MAG: hypothetical protein R2771_04100 [Saprospiraceae bacterium]